MATLLFNANDHEPSKPMGPVPEGSYLVAMKESEIKPTKAGDGSILAMVFEVLSGEHKGRKIYDNLNIRNPSQQATQIAQENLSAICHAVNVLKLQDSVQLHDLPLMVEVVCEAYNKADGTRAIKNNIKAYKSKLHTEPVAGATQQQPAYSPQQQQHQPAVTQQQQPVQPPPWAPQR